MLPFFYPLADAARFSLEAQQVIAARLLKISAGGPAATLEAQRMVGEKVLAFWESQARVGLAMFGGAGALTGATKPYRSAVRANRRRLARRRKR